MSAALFRSARNAIAVSRPIRVPCQMKCSSAQPTAWTAGSFSKVSIPLITHLPAVAAVDQVPDLRQLLRRGAPGRQRLHDQLRCRSAEGTVHEIAHELPLRLLLAEPRVIDVRPIG